MRAVFSRVRASKQQHPRSTSSNFGAIGEDPTPELPETKACKSRVEATGLEETELNTSKLSSLGAPVVSEAQLRAGEPGPFISHSGRYSLASVWCLMWDVALQDMDAPSIDERDVHGGSTISEGMSRRASKFAAVSPKAGAFDSCLAVLVLDVAA